MALAMAARTDGRVNTPAVGGGRCIEVVAIDRWIDRDELESSPQLSYGSDNREDSERTNECRKLGEE